MDQSEQPTKLTKKSSNLISPKAKAATEPKVRKDAQIVRGRNKFK